MKPGTCPNLFTIVSALAANVCSLMPSTEVEHSWSVLVFELK
jgi:hypothetical protein